MCESIIQKMNTSWEGESKVGTLIVRKESKGQSNLQYTEHYIDSQKRSFIFPEFYPYRIFLCYVTLEHVPIS